MRLQDVQGRPDRSVTPQGVEAVARGSRLPDLGCRQRRCAAPAGTGAAELQLAAIVNRSVHRKRVDWVDPSVRWTDDVADVLGGDVDISWSSSVGDPRRGLDPSRARGRQVRRDREQAGHRACRPGIAR